MLERFCDHCKKEWAVLRQAPIAFCVTMLLAIAIAFAAGSWLYGRELDTQKATIEFQTQKLEDYRNKLQGASPEEAAKELGMLRSQVAELRQQVEPPKLNTVSETEQANPDGTYSISLIVEVIARVRPGKLTIKAAAAGLKEVSISPSAMSEVETGKNSDGLDVIATSITGPRGTYTITFTTRDKTPIHWIYEF